MAIEMGERKKWILMKLKPLPWTFCPKRFTFGLIIELQSYFLVLNPSFHHQFQRTRLRKPQIRKAWSIMTRAYLTIWYCLKRSVVTMVTRVQNKNVSTRIVVQYVMRHCHKLQKMILISLPTFEFTKTWHWIRKRSTQTNSLMSFSIALHDAAVRHVYLCSRKAN